MKPKLKTMNLILNICIKYVPQQNEGKPGAHLHCILTDLVDRLWSVVNESLTRDPVVFTQFHRVLQQEADPSRQLLVVH